MNEGSRFYIRSAVLIFLLISVVYGRLYSNDFINFDDPDYVTENHIIQKGLTPAGILWAFSIKDNDLTYWHPLTYIAHMADCQLFGLKPGLHHLSNLFIHFLNSILLLILITRLTGKKRAGAAAALLFALHPVGVDSVAWIAQKKTLLVAFFWFSAMLAYFAYTVKGGLKRYLAASVFVLCGLMSKPVMVAIPLVFICMDFWPVNRLKKCGVSVKLLIAEKIPPVLFALMWAGTIFIPDHVLAKNISFEEISLVLRFKNMIVSYLVYIRQFFLPYDLVIINPYPTELSWVRVIIAFTVLAGITAMALKYCRKYPWFLFGWILFIIATGPSSGLIQGAVWPAHADRFVYISFTGFYLISGYLFSVFTEKTTGNIRRALTFSGILLVFSMAALTWHQIGYWKNSISVNSHAISRTKKNHIAYNNLGTAFQSAGETDKALEQFFLSLWAKPGFSKALHNIAIACVKKERYDDAISYFLKSLQSNPHNYIANYNLGSLYEKQGRHDSAIHYFKKAILVKPDFADAYNNTGAIYQNKGELAEAASFYRKALQINPDHVNTLCNMGNILIDSGRFDEAVLMFNRGLLSEPENLAALNGLVISRLAKKEVGKAGEIVEKMLRAAPKNEIAKNNALLVRDCKTALEKSAGKTESELKELKAGCPDCTGKKYDLLCIKGSFLKSLGKYGEAKETWLKAVALSPEKYQAFFLLAELAGDSGDYADAIIFYTKAAEADPERRADALYSIGCVYGISGNANECVKWVSRAVDAGFCDWERLKSDYRLNNIRESESFREFCSVAGIDREAE